MTAEGSHHCQCGSSISVWSTPDAVVDIVRIWEAFHQGPGHGPATREQAGAARSATLQSVEEQS
jgi:hypothetical protein